MIITLQMKPTFDYQRCQESRLEPDPYPLMGILLCLTVQVHNGDIIAYDLQARLLPGDNAEAKAKTEAEANV